tara:strand:+ start:86 stop:250 length:165 start_codon:yes stop_codon:yes gene_type:complete
LTNHKFFLLILISLPLVVSSKEATKWKVNQAEKIAFFVIEKLDFMRRMLPFSRI